MIGGGDSELVGNSTGIGELVVSVSEVSVDDGVDERVRVGIAGSDAAVDDDN